MSTLIIVTIGKKQLILLNGILMTMGNFDRNNKFNRGRDFKKRNFNDHGSSRPSMMHSAICSNCGKECQVPFRPSGDKPVYCSKCFEKNGGSESRRSEERYPRRSNFEDKQSLSSNKQMYQAVCDNCGNDCKVPFQPRGDKPIYCSNCFENKTDNGNRTNEQPQNNKQLE